LLSPVPWMQVLGTGLGQDRAVRLAEGGGTHTQGALGTSLL
jgi:hypothetical protein